VLTPVDTVVVVVAVVDGAFEAYGAVEDDED
jgi:hypothetical protein